MIKIIRHILLVCIALVITHARVYAQSPETSDTSKGLDMLSYVIFAEDANREAFEIDSLFYLRSLPIVFAVGRTDQITSNRELQYFVNYGVPMIKGQNVRNARIRIRSAASPEGPLALNKRLSRGRRDALLKIFEENGVTVQELQVDVVDEEYELLAFMMRQANDPDAALVSRMVAEGINDPVKLKRQLQSYDKGRLWRRLLKEYFPPLRASRFMIIFPENTADEVMNLGVQPLQAERTDLASYRLNFPDTLLLGTVLQWGPEPEVAVRRELLALKTNLLEWGAYVPQYGWCPMPNVELEYYPKHGHWTFGATFDCPWWIGNTSNHKYFELRNYQLYTRYYLRNSDSSYSDERHTVPAADQAAFRGFYLQAYTQAFLYQIGFTAKKGWIGEGLGGGFGAGYVLPLSRDGHWRLDFGMQLGLFRTQYDPFVYGKPVYHGGEIDGNYYYNTDLYSDNFVKRMHRYTWFGPTRIGISISYDLLYRKRQGKRPSFSKWEKGDGR